MCWNLHLSRPERSSVSLHKHSSVCLRCVSRSPPQEVTSWDSHRTKLTVHTSTTRESSEHQTIAHDILTSAREQLQNPVVRIGVDCRNESHDITSANQNEAWVTAWLARVLTHVSRLQPQVEGSAVFLAPLHRTDTNGRRTFRNHQPTNDLLTLQHNNTNTSVQ